MVKKNTLTKTTVVNSKGKEKSTLRTSIPALVRDFLELKSKDKIQWNIHPETMSVTITKEKTTKINQNHEKKR